MQRIQARIFTANIAYDIQVEVARCCRQCRTKHQWTVGPDGSEYGLFNWSNTMLFDYSLLEGCLADVRIVLLELLLILLMLLPA